MGKDTFWQVHELKCCYARESWTSNGKKRVSRTSTLPVNLHRKGIFFSGACFGCQQTIRLRAIPTFWRSLITLSRCVHAVTHCLSMVHDDLMNTSVDRVDVRNIETLTSISINNDTSTENDSVLGWPPWYVVVLHICYWAFIVAGGVGNILVLIVATYRRSRKQVSPNMVRLNTCMVVRRDTLCDWLHPIARSCADFLPSTGQ